MDKEAQDVFYKTAKGFEEVVDFLSAGVTPILGAVLVNNAEMVEHLISAGFDPNAGNSSKFGLPLEAALRNGYAEIAGILVEGGANVTEKEMSSAIGGKSLECVELLLSPYIAYCGPGAGATELMFKAIESNHSGILRALLDASLGFEGNISVAPAGMSLSALGAAIRRDNPSMVRLLLDRGADVRGTVFVNNQNKSYLQFACEEAGGEVVRTLLAAGLDVNEPFGKNLPIHVVADIRAVSDDDARRQFDVMQVLLDWGADIVAKNASGRTLMQIVAKSEPMRQLVASVKTAHSVEMAFGVDDDKAGHATSSARKTSGPGPL